MTRKSKREIERAVADLADQADGDEGDLFEYPVRIGGDPQKAGGGGLRIVIGADAQEAGVHRWDPDAGAYVNDHGHEIPPDAATEGHTDR